MKRLSQARRPDGMLGLSRSARHYVPRPRDDSALIEAIEAHLKDNLRYGFGLLFDESFAAEEIRQDAQLAGLRSHEAQPARPGQTSPA